MRNIAMRTLENHIEAMKDDFGFQLEAFELEAEGRDFWQESLRDAQNILANPELLKQNSYEFKTYLCGGEVLYRRCEDLGEKLSAYFQEETDITTVFAYQQGTVHVVQVLTKHRTSSGSCRDKMETYFLFEGRTWICFYGLPQLIDCSVTKSDQDNVTLLLSFTGGEIESYCFV